MPVDQSIFQSLIILADDQEKIKDRLTSLFHQTVFDGSSHSSVDFWNGFLEFCQKHQQIDFDDLVYL